MTKPTNGIEEISVRRVSIADANKVRYRVYTTANDFVAVIAESALMAVRVSGVKAPYKIMRDMPSEGGMIEAAKLAPRDDTASAIAFNPSAVEKPEPMSGHRTTELEQAVAEDSVLFVPMGLSELQKKGMNRARILPAEMLQEIIEAHTKQAPQSVAEHPLESFSDEVVFEETSQMPAMDLARMPEPSPSEKLAQLADEVLTEPTAETEESAPDGKRELTPEEVEKLLNG